MSLVNNLYKMSRLLGQSAAVIRDIEVLSTKDSDMIRKRAVKKVINKVGYEVTKSAARKVK